MEAEPHQIGKGNRMDSMSVFRASWKVRLVAFGLGILVAAAAFGIALGVSDDLRLLYVSGALLLAFATFLLGVPAREDLIAAVLLLSRRRSCSRSLSCRKHLFFGQRFCCGWRLSCGCYSGSDSPELSQSLGL
jgi:hypothetical protein